MTPENAAMKLDLISRYPETTPKPTPLCSCMVHSRTPVFGM